MTFKGKLDLVLLFVTISAIPVVFFDGVNIPNEFTLLMLVIMSGCIGFSLHVYYPNHIPLYTTYRQPLFWEWMTVGLLVFLTVILAFTFVITILVDEYTILGSITGGIALCATLRITIPYFIVVIYTTKTAFNKYNEKI